MTREIRALREIAGAFDAVLIDQYGVLHDGRAPFPGAVECLTALQSCAVPVVAVTNSGKRAALNLARLERLGFPRDLFHGLVSSGELTRAELIRRLQDGRLRAGDRVAVLSRDGDTSPLEGLDLHRVEPSEDCALLLILGVDPERLSLEAYEAQLAPLARRGVPALCANPDRAMYGGAGVVFGAGVVAEAYRRRGGEALDLGKPAAPMFHAALALLPPSDAERVLMIGDSLEHDIAGAAAIGCPTLLLRSGVQSGIGAPDTDPTFAMDALIW